MAKAKRLLAEQLRRVDVVIELCDARLPYSSRNPDLDKLIAGKKRVLLLNKADLADSGATSAWLQFFRAQGIDAAPYNAASGKAKDALAVIDRAAKETVERAAQKGVRKTVRAMVVGVPNVGKSTFTNRLHGGSIAKTGDRPGVTRANQWVRISPYLELLDTPGLLWPRLDDQLAARRLCYIGTVKDDVVDLPMLTIHLLQDLLAVKPEAVMERFRFDDPDLTGEALLEAVCRGRGFLMKGGVCDYDRCCAVVLDEFRAGKLGRMTLEMPQKERRRLTIPGAASKEENHGED
ncbi:MAG: ribosome biogenesis GTPase YlqF [Christensenellaceae bacterium]|nr:ribosome biogenesis GTPase YlqF [Christensenellaceae bacterium]